MLLIGYLVTQYQTTVHKFWVLYHLMCFSIKMGQWKILYRGLIHDISKYKWVEAKYFSKNIFKLWKTSYGTEDYKKLLQELKPAIDHHVKNNSHHPEFYANGVFDMTREDKIEMICDWLAAVRRHSDGDINKSLDINKKRFGYNDEIDAELKDILFLIRSSKLYQFSIPWNLGINSHFIVCLLEEGRKFYA